ncbi:MAG: hypothetical protein HQK51_20835 [Oligoflexia bacterium]|nr:hypothetical protein [Oligoflexia bacterium]
MPVRLFSNLLFFLLIPVSTLAEVHYVNLAGHNFHRIILTGSVDQHASCNRAERRPPLPINIGVHLDPAIPDVEMGKQLCLSIKNTQLQKIRPVLDGIKNTRSGNGNTYFISGSLEYGGGGSCQITSWSNTSFKIILYYADHIFFHRMDTERPTMPLLSFTFAGTIECLFNNEYQWRCLFLDDQSSFWNEESEIKHFSYDANWKIEILQKLEGEISSYL